MVLIIKKKGFLPKILNSEHWWCQGYSEPNSGSDLASLQTKATLKGNNYIVSGTKTWTTLAQYADWMFCLVRTKKDGKPQEGISFLLIDMNSKGIKVEPIITIDGSHEVNTVYLEDVIVPKENLIYQENKGWSVAKFLLSHERTSIAQVARSRSAIKKLKYIASQETYDNQALIKNVRFRDKLTELEMDMHALEYSELRILSEEVKGTAPGPESSFLKIRGSELQQRISELTLEAVGHFGLLQSNESQLEQSNEYYPGPEYSNNTGANYLNLRKTTIYGGSNEIQKNILSKMVLGLVMNLTLSEDQVLIRDSAQKFLEVNYSFEKELVFLKIKKSHLKTIGKNFSELGWLGLAFSEDIGGFDGNINNLMTLMERIGASLVLEPIIFNNIIVGKLFEQFSIENKSKFLQEIISEKKYIHYCLVQIQITKFNF